MTSDCLPGGFSNLSGNPDHNGPLPLDLLFGSGIKQGVRFSDARNAQNHLRIAICLHPRVVSYGSQYGANDWESLPVSCDDVNSLLHTLKAFCTQMLRIKTALPTCHGTRVTLLFISVADCFSTIQEEKYPASTSKRS